MKPSRKPRLGWWYLGLCTVFALVLVFVLYDRGRPPPPPPIAAVPHPDALSPEDRADFDQAADATRVVVGAALLTRVWRWEPPTAGAWPSEAAGEAAALEARGAIVEALASCDWEGKLRALDCRTPPCVARLTGDVPLICEGWPAAITQAWTASSTATDTGE